MGELLVIAFVAVAPALFVIGIIAAIVGIGKGIGFIHWHLWGRRAWAKQYAEMRVNFEASAAKQYAERIKSQLGA